jgi:hypothetical protein
MAQLAIKGHPTRGKEVIEILEMLGGENEYKLNGCNIECAYYKKNGVIHNTSPVGFNNIKLLTLEKFLEKFPYKVGDKVQHNGATSCGSIYIIEQMKWEDNQVKYVICDLYWKNCKCTVTSKDLQPYKEEDFGECIEKTIDICLFGKKETTDRKYNVEEYLKVWKETDKGLEVVVNDRFELKEYNGKFYIIKKQQQYPKTYEECCRVLGIIDRENGYCGYKLELLGAFQELLICRDAYWKIAGDWKPDYMYCDLYCIGYDGNVITWKMQGGCRLLAFPTEEMRDTFYENFKELIELVKELL